MPNTSNREILIRVNARTDEVHTCRHTVATNTVILTENQNNETSEGSGGFVPQGVTLTGQGDLEQEHLSIKERSWSRDLPGDAQSGFFQKDSLVHKATKKSERD